jgi:hypothetical protein
VLSSLVTVVRLYDRFKVASSRLRSFGMSRHVIWRICTQRFGWIYCFHVQARRAKLIPIYQTVRHQTTRTLFLRTTRLSDVRCAIGRASRTWNRHGAMFFRTCKTSCSTGSRRPGCGVQSAKPHTDSCWRWCLSVADVWEKLRAESCVPPQTLLNSYMFLP